VRRIMVNPAARGEQVGRVWLGQVASSMLRRYYRVLDVFRCRYGSRELLGTGRHLLRAVFGEQLDRPSLSDIPRTEAAMLKGLWRSRRTCE
jgi:hypothetical protein